MDMSELKNSIKHEIENVRNKLVEVSLNIHRNPELGFHEYQAVEWLTELLTGYGFYVEKGICDLPTAFRATYGSGKPVIAFLAEYDALPEAGHACGHNIICAAAAGAAIGARMALKEAQGSITVLGTPAEELHGGKIILVNRGAFKEIDVALMVHPGTVDAATTQALACQTIEVDFFGKAAHAAANPEKGINALEAMILSYNAINSLRQHIKSSARIHGIITDGGRAPNIVPEHSAGTFLVRAENDLYLEELKPKVLSCFEGAARATGCRMVYRWEETRYSAMRNNMELAKIFQRNLQSLGRNVLLLEPSATLGSTDMGNVSQVVPSIHPFVAIAPEGVPTHSAEFARAAGSEIGMQGMIDAAIALAWTASDLLTNQDLIKKVRIEFESND